MEQRVVIETLSFEKLWLAGCTLNLKRGRVWKAEKVHSRGGILPHESGKHMWHNFEEDTVKWVYGGGIDWQDYTWEFEEATFTMPKFDSKGVNPTLLLSHLTEKCGDYVDVDMEEMSMKAKSGWVICLNKFPHNGGNEFIIKSKE